MTQCFGETIVGLMLKEIKERGKDMKVVCARQALFPRRAFDGQRGL